MIPSQLELPFPPYVHIPEWNDDEDVILDDDFDDFSWYEPIDEEFDDEEEV